MTRRVMLLLTVALAAGAPAATRSNVSSVGSAAPGSTAPIVQEQVTAKQAPRLLRRAPEIKAPKLSRYTVRTPDLDLPGSVRAGFLGRVSSAENPQRSPATPEGYPPVPPLPGEASALNYTVEIFGAGYTVQTGVIGVPMDIDGNFDGAPDAILELIGTPPTAASNVLAVRALVRRLNAVCGPGGPLGGCQPLGPQNYGMWINYFTDNGGTVYSFGFDAREGGGAPVLLDLTVTVTTGSVLAAVATQGPLGPVTLLARRWAGGPPWPTKYTGFVRFDPIPPSVTFNLIPSSADRGNATVTVSSPTHVSASFFRDDPQGSNTSEHRFGVSIPTLPGFLGIAWMPESVGEVRARTVQLDVHGTIDADLTYSQHILTPSGGDTVVVDAVALLRGLGGFWNVRMREWPYPAVRVEPASPGTSPIGSIEVGVGVGATAAIARVAYDYVNYIGLSGGEILVSGRLAGVKSAAFVSGFGGVYELILDHTGGPLLFWYSDGARRANGSMTLPDSLHVLIDTGAMAAEVKPSSGPVTDIQLYLRALSGPWFGRVWQVDGYVSNLDPGTRLAVASASSAVVFSLTTGAAIRLMDFHLRSDGNIFAGDLLPAGWDGVLLHDVNRYVVHARVSGLQGVEASWRSVTCHGLPCLNVEGAMRRNVRTPIRVEVLTAGTSLLGTIDNPPRDWRFGAYSTSAGTELFYDATEESGQISLTAVDSVSRTEATIAGLPRRQGNQRALSVCLYSNAGCGVATNIDPQNINPHIRLTGYVVATAPITVQNLRRCDSASCSSGAQIRATNVTGRILNLMYAEKDNGLLDTNHRWIYVDTGGSLNAISGDLLVTGLPLGAWIDAKLRGVWASEYITRFHGLHQDYEFNAFVCGAGTSVVATGFNVTWMFC